MYWNHWIAWLIEDNDDNDDNDDKIKRLGVDQTSSHLNCALRIDNLKEGLVSLSAAHFSIYSSIWPQLISEQGVILWNKQKSYFFVSFIFFNF